MAGSLSAWNVLRGRAAATSWCMMWFTLLLVRAELLQPPSLENSRPYYPVRQQYVGFLKPRCIQLVRAVYTLRSALLKSSGRAVSSYYISLFCLNGCMQMRVKVRKGMNQDVCHGKGHWNNAWTCSLQGTPLASESDKGKGATLLQFFQPTNWREG